MLIEFDPAKDAANLRKHGVSLAEAAVFEWDTARILADDRFDMESSDSRQRVTSVRGCMW